MGKIYIFLRPSKIASYWETLCVLYTKQCQETSGAALQCIVFLRMHISFFCTFCLLFFDTGIRIEILDQFL